MKRRIVVVLLSILPYICFGQMMVNGKLTDIRNASKQQVLKAMVGEYIKNDSNEECSIKIDNAGNFKMYYSKTIKGNNYNYGSGGWTLRLSGKVTLYDANTQRQDNIKDRYGDLVNVQVWYKRYYAVFTGTDDKGRDHSFCASICQMHDNKYMYGWIMQYANEVPDCYCEDTSDPQTVSLPNSLELKN